MVRGISSRRKFRAEIGRLEMNIVLSTGRYFHLQRLFVLKVFRICGNNDLINIVPAK